MKISQFTESLNLNREMVIPIVENGQNLKISLGKIMDALKEALPTGGGEKSLPAIGSNFQKGCRIKLANMGISYLYKEFVGRILGCDFYGYRKGDGKPAIINTELHFYWYPQEGDPRFIHGTVLHNGVPVDDISVYRVDDDLYVHFPSFAAEQICAEFYCTNTYTGDEPRYNVATQIEDGSIHDNAQCRLVIDEVKQTVLTGADGKINVSNLPVDEILGTDRPPRAIIDLWNILCGDHGRYNEETKLGELNGLTNITYPQMLDIIAAGSVPCPYAEGYYRGKQIRTNLPPKARGSAYKYQMTFLQCRELETALISNAFAGYATFAECSKLRIIGKEEEYTEWGFYDLVTTDVDCFAHCESLEYIDGAIRGEGNIDVKDSPNLSLKNFTDWFKKAYNTGPVFIIVHKEVHAKFMDDPDWKVLRLGFEHRNISIITPPEIH